ncbi:MAG: 2,4'-dihydroxyacetophenone dioxygenase family protein [Actinomycetes bacterium]
MTTSDSVTADTTVCRSDQLPWAELAPGIEIKVLRVGGDTGRYTLMNRFAPGTVLPRHHHFGEVHAFTLAGRWGYLEYDWEAEAGDYIYEEAGSVHTLTVPADATEPAVIQFVIDQGMDFLDADGQPFHREDATSITELYLHALDAAGTPRPDGVLP